MRFGVTLLMNLAALIASPAGAVDAASAQPDHCHDLAMRFAVDIFDGLNTTRTNPPRAELESTGLAATMVKFHRRLNEAKDPAARTALLWCVEREVLAKVQRYILVLPETDQAAVAAYVSILEREANLDEGSAASEIFKRKVRKGNVSLLVTKVAAGLPVGVFFAPFLTGVPSHPSATYYALSTAAAWLALAIDHLVAKSQPVRVAEAGYPLRACVEALRSPTSD